MKIIKQQDSKQVTCEHCKSVLEYTDYDIKSHQMGVVIDRTWIVCPVCGREITLTERHPTYIGGIRSYL